MILKRLYLPNAAYGYYFHPEIRTYHEFAEWADDNSDIDAWDIDNATYVISDLSNEEQDTMWLSSIKMIMDNTRWVLDNLGEISEYKTRWNNYGKARLGHGCPPVNLTKHCDKTYNYVSKT